MPGRVPAGESDILRRPSHHARTGPRAGIGGGEGCRDGIGFHGNDLDPSASKSCCVRTDSAAEVEDLLHARGDKPRGMPCGQLRASRLLDALLCDKE